MLRRARTWRTPLRIAGCGVVLAACVGSIGDGGDLPGALPGAAPGGSGLGGTSQTQVLCTTPSPGAAPLRRLTQAEYNNTVRDLLGDSSNPAAAFPPDQKVGAFSNTAISLTVSPLLAQGYETAAEQLASRAIGNLAALSSCDTATIGEDACATQFIATFGKRAFRRVLTQDETTGLLALYQANKAGADYNNGIQAVIEAILQSAPFLYRAEFGDAARALAGPPGSGGVVPLTSYEIASRLSYFLWGSMPDDALFAAADRNQLLTADQIAAQATRMLADPKAHPAVDEFFGEWLGVDDIDNAPKDPATYAIYTPQVRDAMQSETLAFVDWVMWQSDATVGTLLTSPVTFANASLAQVYGVQGVTGDAMQKVQLDPAQRAGIITQGAVLTVLAKPDRSSPVLRGKFVREKLLCQTVSPPPQNIVITPPPVTPGVSTREMFSMHSTVEPCKSCHALMDPIGFGFEHYDGIGRWRTVDQGQPVDASGTLSASDVNGTFDGAVALAKKLAQSKEVSDCVATQWFRYAIGRGDTTEDACTLQSLKQSMSGSKSDMRKLLVAITQADTFRYRPAVKP
jgi:hypothetical protein